MNIRTLAATVATAVALVVTAAPAEAARSPFRNEGRSVTHNFSPGPQCSLLPCVPESTHADFPGPVHPCFQEPCPPIGSRAAHRR